MTIRAADPAETRAAATATPPGRRPLSAQLFGATHSLSHQFARYLVVGGLAFLVDFGSLYLLTEFAGLHYLRSAAVAFLLGLVANYLLSRVWVFDQRTVKNVAAEFAIFTVIGVVGLGLNEVIIWFVREKVHLHYMAAKAISSAIVLVWNFGARKAVLFSERPLGAGMTRRIAFPVAALWPAGAGVAYFFYCLAIQASSGAWQATFVAYPDEPSHFVGAVMVRDWLRSGHWTAPFSFAQEYYRHYPFFAVGYWPPAFHLVTGLAFLLAGVGRMQALLIPAACAAMTAWLVFRLLKQRIGGVAAFCAGAVYLSLPAVQQWFCAVMVDHMTACLSIATAALLLRYLRRPDNLNGILLALSCAFAILSKYSAAYAVALPWAAILLYRRFGVLRKPSFLVQPVIIAVLVGPWALWTRKLAYYGLPSERFVLTPDRALLFVAQTFEIFPPVLMAVVILGVLALIVLPGSWREDVGVLGLLCAGQISFLFLSPVMPDQRYLLAPAASLLVISLAGWGAALSRGLARYGRRPVAAGASAAALTVVFALVYFGAYPRPRQYPIRLIAETVLKNAAWAGQRILAPSDLEGAFIAEFAAQDRHRPASYVLRPGKVLARSNWFGGDYLPLFSSPEQMTEYFQQNPVGLIIWHDRPEQALRVHERILREMIQRNPLLWRKAAAFASDDGTPSWTIYERVSR